MKRHALQRLRVRHEPPLNQLETAQRAGVIYSRYVRIENGYTAPTPAEERAIARALRVPLEEAFPVAATA